MFLNCETSLNQELTMDRKTRKAELTSAVSS
jgi:hypothetical protein